MTKTATKKPTKKAPAKPDQSQNEDNPFRPLPEDQRAAMKRDIKKAKTPANVLAEKYGVSRNTIIFHAEKEGVELPNGNRLERSELNKIRKANGLAEIGAKEE